MAMIDFYRIIIKKVIHLFILYKYRMNSCEERIVMEYYVKLTDFQDKSNGTWTTICGCKDRIIIRVDDLRIKKDFFICDTCGARFYVSYEGFNTDEAIKKYENYEIFYESEEEYSESEDENSESK
uniref:Uncharacterized protein n=1 Tax=Mimivirus LCMiAC02 TaxID=2506609 RepID=A0A4P6VQU2_9VIRU|nr:MAG: hypothetical protein LCMiAC02_05200 [Mimivirus LCMiAC02]